MPLNNLKLISAGAGSGKTYRLTQEMAKLLTDQEVRPSGIIATTFTKRAAAELKERVRVKLLREGMTREAGELTNALIGTVHGLGVKLLRRFAFEAGVSPQVDIIADGDDQRLFNLSMAAVISTEQIERIEMLCEKLGLSRSGEKYNWRKDVLGLVEIIRGNNFGADTIERSKTKSWETLVPFLPPRQESPTLDQYQNRIAISLKETSEALYNNEADGTKKTAAAAGNLRGMLSQLKRRGYLPWLEYAKLGKFQDAVGAKSRELVEDIVKLGQQHAGLSAFQHDLRGYQDLLFDCARASIEEYDRYKKNRGRIDYTDMEVLVLKLLDHPSVRETLQRELDLLMVDEFQDTSPIQLAIFLRLSQLAKRSIWVGDPKQSIYGFRGAEPRLMAAVMNANGPIDPKNIQTDSWRSREDVVYACNSLFVSAFPEIDPAAVALDPVRKREGGKFAPAESDELKSRSGLVHWHFTPEGRTRHSIAFMQSTLAKAIREMLENPPPILPKGEDKERPLRASDVAILCRSNYGCVAVAEALTGQGIPAAIARTGLLQTAEATLMLACLKYLLSPSDSLSTAEIMLFGSRRSLPDIIEDRLEFLANPDKKMWGEGNELLGKLDELRGITSEHSTSEMLNLLLERLDLRRIIVAWGDGEQRLSNVDELRRVSVAYEDNCHRQHRAASLGGYLLYLDQLVREEKDKQGAGERPDAVNVLTYHRSKGLEWPAVICFNLDQKLRADVWGRAVVPETEDVDLDNPLADRWLRFWVNPYDRLTKGIDWVDALKESEWQTQATNDSLAEEARLLYVGFTRARDYLILPTGKPGAPWVDRVYARGGKETIVLPPDTQETPFSWEGKDIDKFTQYWTEPGSQPRAEMTYHPIPFIAGKRPGRAAYLPHFVDDEWLLAHYGESEELARINYFPPEEPDPATDQRLYGQVLAQFLHGDPVTEEAYRHELASNLLRDFQPGGELDIPSILRQSDSWRDTIDTYWAGARVQKFVPLRGSAGKRYYQTTLDWLLEMPNGESILIKDVFGNEKQYRSQAGLHLAKARLQADLLQREHGIDVAATFLHRPAAGQLIEVKL